MYKEIIQDFFSKSFNRYLLVALILLGVLAYALPEIIGNGDLDGEDRLTIQFFHMPGCPHCADEKAFFEDLKEDYPSIEIISHDVTAPGEFDVYVAYFEAYGIEDGMGSVPMTLIGEKFILGFDSADTTGQTIRKHVSDCVENGCPSPEDILKDGNITTSATVSEFQQEELDIELPFIGKIDAAGMSLPVLAILLGVIDGFNPCAMWVLVYMIALLMELKDPRRMWLIVGIFLAASGILYFLFMTAWLNVFLFLGYIRIITVIVGCAALGFGILNFKEYYDTKGAIVCNVGSGDDKAKTAKKMKDVINAEMTIFTLGSIVALAFAVNSIEFVCSSALPAVFTQVLALAELPFIEHYAYILLYVLFFMIDDIIIFSLAAMAMSKLSVGEKYVGVSKILGGLILVLLGIMMLFFPDLLR
jgi:glutaredoxin